MKAQIAILALLLAMQSASAAQDTLLPVRTLTINAVYEIKPFCWQYPPCEYLTYQGDVQIRASTRESDGAIDQFELRIDGRDMGLRLNERYPALTNVDLGDVKISRGPAYVPIPFREQVLGGGPPYLSFNMILGTDPACELQRFIVFSFNLESSEFTFRDGCLDPLEGFVGLEE